MSQLRAMRPEFRAAFAVAAVCALMFSLLSSGAMRPAHALAERSDIACDHFGYLSGTHAVSAQKGISAERDGLPARPAHRCPDCCLSAHAGHAVLPERVASVARPSAERAVSIHHSAVAALPPKSLTSSGANGARAPPSI